MISTSSWRDGQKLVKKILGPAPRMEQKERRAASSDRSGRERAAKFGERILLKLFSNVLRMLTICFKILTVAQKSRNVLLNLDRSREKLLFSEV